MVNQKYTYQEFLYILLFHIVALRRVCSLNKYTTNILKASVKDENNNAKNSTTFSNYIRNVPIEHGKIMVSFDVSSLYTNIPIIDTLNIFKDYVSNDDQLTRKTSIPLDKFFDLVNLVLATIWSTFNSQFYQQTDSIFNNNRNLYAGS